MLDYDLWANQRWLTALAGFRDLGRASEILEHMLSAQRIWLERIGVDISHGQTNVPLSAVFEGLYQHWKRIAEDANLDQVIVYKNSAGDEFRNSIGEIAYHVVNHGTYHRGQLRGLAESEGFTGFPDTDLILFLRE